MAKINGTSVLLYADGTLVALQRDLSISVEQDLPDATSKESAGWAEHINGLRNATVTFDALYSTTGLSAASLLTYITGRTSLLMVILGLSYPLIAEVDVNNLSLVGNREEPGSLSGTLKIKGKLYLLMGGSAQLVTDPDAGGTTYDTYTVSGLAVTSAINLADSAAADTNTFSVTSGDIVKLAVFLTLNSGQAPTVKLTDPEASDYSNDETLAEGLNIVTLTATGTYAAVVLRILNTAAANWSMSNIYLFKDPN